jgi:hypothetical protein
MHHDAGKMDRNYFALAGTAELQLFSADEASLAFVGTIAKEPRPQSATNPRPTDSTNLKRLLPKRVIGGLCGKLHCALDTGKLVCGCRTKLTAAERERKHVHLIQQAISGKLSRRLGSWPARTWRQRLCLLRRPRRHCCRTHSRSAAGRRQLQGGRPRRLDVARWPHRPLGNCAAEIGAMQGGATRHRVQIDIRRNAGPGAGRILSQGFHQPGNDKE